MDNTDVTVSFGADTQGLSKSIADAKATVAGFGTSTAGLKASLDQLNSTMMDNVDASAAANSGWRANIATLSQLTIILGGAYEAVSSLTDGMVDAARAGQWAGVDIRNGIVQAATMGQDAGLGLRDSIASATAAILAYAEASAQGAGAARSFIHDQEGIVASMGRLVVAATTAINELRLYQTDVAKTELAGIAANGAMPKFVDAVGLDKLKESLVGFTAQLQRIPNMSDEAATSIQVMLASIPGYTVEANADLIKLLATISATGDDAVANAQKITAAFSDTSAAGGQNIAAMVGAMVDNLKASTADAEQFKAQLGDINTLSKFFAETLQPASASAYYSAIISKLEAQNAIQKTMTDSSEAALKREGALGAVISYTREHQVQLERDQNTERQKAIDLLTQQKAITDQIVSAQARQSTFQTTLDKSNPVDAQIDDVSSKIGILQGQLNLGTGKTTALTAEDITALTRTVLGEAGNQPAEGQLAVAAVALNRLANGNFGDSLTAVLKAGNGSQFNTWKPGDPTGQQNAPTDSYQFQKTLQDIVMPLLQKQVADPTGGALNFLNPNTAQDKSWMNGMTGQKQIGDHLFGTAQNAPAPIDPMNDDDVEKTTQALQALQDKLQQLQVLKAGGTATDQANLQIAQQAVTEGQDQVAAAQKLLDAKKQEAAVAASGSPAAQTKAAQAVADAQIALQQKVAEAAVAASKVEADAYQKGSFEEVAALNEGLAQKLAGQKQGTAEFNATLSEMISNTKKAVEQEQQDQASAADATYQNAKRRLDEQLADVKTAASEKRITAAQEVTELDAIYAQMAAADRAYQTQRQQIFGEGTTEYRKAALELQQVGEQLNAQQLAAARAAAKEVEQSWTSAFEQVGSSVSSSLEGMLEGATTFKGLLQNVARQITSMFISENLKIAADWLAKQAMQVAGTETAETAKTGAVAAGTAARESLSIASLASGAAATLASVTRSIAASAAEAFAGVVGFLSPILGPAAVGPAAGVEATVLAAGSAIPKMDIGAYNLPSDMLAMVHKNELVMPAAEAGAFRNMLSNQVNGDGRTAMSGGNNSGASGAVPNVTIYHTSYGRRSQSEIEAETETMAKSLMRHMGINRATWQGAIQGVTR